MTSKKVFACFGAILLVVQSPLSTFAATPPQEPTMQEAFLMGLQKGFDSPAAMNELEKGIDSFKPTYREQFHINRITKQLEAIIEKADTNEAKIQKTINVNVLLMDTLIANAMPIVTKAISSENNPNAMEEVEKEIVLTHFESKLKIVGGAIKQISEKYMGPELKEYMSFLENLQDEVNQKDIDTIVQKVTALYNMSDNAFDTYAPTINKLLKENVGINTKELYHHARVFILLGLQMLMDEENKDLNPSDPSDAKDIAEITAGIGYIKHALENSDERTKAAYTVYTALVAQGGGFKTYRDSIKSSFKKEFVDMVDMLTPMINQRMETTQTRARDVKVKADVTQLGSALAVYGSDNGNYNKLSLFTNTNELKQSLVLDNNYILDIPQPLDGTPYRFSTLKRNSIKDAAFMVMGKAEDPTIANWIDEDGWIGSNKSLSNMDIGIIENSLCTDITIGTKDSLKDCTAVPNSTKLAYIYTY